MLKWSPVSINGWNDWECMIDFSFYVALYDERICVDKIWIPLLFTALLNASIAVPPEA